MTNAVLEQQSQLKMRIGQIGQSGQPGQTPPPGPAGTAPNQGDALSANAIAGLRLLLRELGWPGGDRHLMEALPHFEPVLNIDEFRSVLARLNFQTDVRDIKLSNLEDEVLPCLCSPDGTNTIIVLCKQAGKLRTFNLSSGREEMIAPESLSGKVYLIEPVDFEKQVEAVSKNGWLNMLTRRFRALIVMLLVITFVSNLLALAVPIYIMSVYDKVIGTNSVDSLMYFFIGIAIVLAADFALRLIRARAIAYLGTRYDALLGPAAFQKILSLPIAMSESVPIGSQVSRLKQFESVREVFSGSLANTVLDLPFLLVFLGAIVVFGGAVAWAPITLIALYGVMAAITVPLTKKYVANAGENRAKMQNFLIELTGKQNALHDARAQNVWLRRFRRMAADSLIGHFRSQQFSTVVQTIAGSMVTIAGVATLAIGTLRVMDGDMTMGALIAVMAMVWRVLSPVQAAFLSLNRLSQVLQSFKHINNLMRMKVERELGDLLPFYRTFTGQIDINRISFRYSPRHEPALMGVTLEIPAGQLVAITGPSGGGKSTLLKLISGLYPAQAGAIQLNGLDLRQIDAGELRHSIAYVPQKANFFYGTIEQNIALAHPEASEAEITRAAAEARIDDYAEFLPDGLQTRLTSKLQNVMPDGLRQRLMLARAYVKNAPIFLLDEPANGLDDTGDKALCDKLERLRGKSTVLMVTHRPSHMRLCDRVIYFEGGQILHDGTPEQVVPLVMRTF